jgi:hypothetical protein
VQDSSSAASLTAASAPTAAVEAAPGNVEVATDVWYARLLTSANALIFSSAPPNSMRIWRAFSLDSLFPMVSMTDAMLLLLLSILLLLCFLYFPRYFRFLLVAVEPSPANEASTPVPSGICLPMLSKSDWSKTAMEYTIALGKRMTEFTPTD